MGSNAEDFGKLALRIALGGLMLFHGVHKLLYGIDQIGAMVTGHGIPAAFSYGVYVGEVIAPVLLIAGLFVRLGGVLVMANMAVAVLLVHTAQLRTLSSSGGWALELQGFYFLTALAIVLLGAGRYAVGRSSWLN